MLGPSLAPTVFVILSSFDDHMHTIINPFQALIGMMIANGFFLFIWWWGALFDAHHGWQITIMPTCIAAILYWAFMVRLTPKILFKSKFIWVMSNLLICACVSGLVFYLISLTLNFQVDKMPITSAFAKYGTTTTEFYTAIVFIIGAILGVIMALMSATTSHSGEHSK